jgi:hypothetical protein
MTSTSKTIKLYKKITKIVGNAANYRNQYVHSTSYKWYAKGKENKVAKKLKKYIKSGDIKINNLRGCHTSIILHTELNFYINKQ